MLSPKRESGNISVCFVVNKAKQQVKWSVRLDGIFLFCGFCVFLKGYLRFESGLERWARVRVACLSTFHCQTLTVHAFSSFRRFWGAL